MDEQQKQLVQELIFSGKKKPSFVGSLFFGIFESKILFPYSSQAKEEMKKFQEYFAKVEHFSKTAIDPVSIDRNAEIPLSVIKGLAELGILGMSVPKVWGGLGMSQNAYCKVAEIISGRCASTALFINAHQSVGLKALLLFGTDEQKNRWLKPLAKGDQIAAFSLTEQNAGSDAAGIETRAVFDPVKNVYRINGRKQWTTNGSMADVLTVMAKTEIDTPNGKQDKVTAFLVTPNMKGFKVLAPALEKVGMRGSKTANLEFIDMEVPAKNILGPLGGGLKVCLTVLDFGRTTFGATCTGVAKSLVAHTVFHAKSRYQFNRPLASFDLVKKKIAEMSALAYAMEATTYQTAHLIDSGKWEIMLESAILKVFASESLWKILYDTMQIYGGRSFFTDHPFERNMRDARLNMIGEGSNEVMRVFIAAVGMRDVGVELKNIVEGLKHPVRDKNLLTSFFGKTLSRIRRPNIPINSEKLKEESTQLSYWVKKFGFAILRLLRHYKEDIVENQLELERIADSAIALYTTSAVLSKLDDLLSQDSKSVDSELMQSSHDLAAGRLYCSMAFELLERNLSALFSKSDQRIIELSDQITGFNTDMKG